MSLNKLHIVYKSIEISLYVDKFRRDVTHFALENFGWKIFYSPLEIIMASVILSASKINNNANLNRVVFLNKSKLQQTFSCKNKCRYELYIYI